ncbi:MAG TPA: hypothetical protein VFG79_10945 [Solirubrobacter sp.]|nr:hypothetical protein [Solirubrobacter sp.]
MQRVLLGDWGRVIRDPIDVMRLAFGVGAVVSAALGDLEDTARLGLTFLAVLGARGLSLPRLFDLAFVIGMALQAFGNSFSLFTSFRYYDVVVHFVLPLACAPCLYILLARWEVVPDLGDETERHHYLGVLLITFALGFSLGALYEIYEWAADHWLGGQLRVGYDDTIADLVDDALASIAGGFFLVLWAERGWGTTRRMPGEAAKRRAAHG